MKYSVWELVRVIGAPPDKNTLPEKYQPVMDYLKQNGESLIDDIAKDLGHAVKTTRSYLTNLKQYYGFDITYRPEYETVKGKKRKLKAYYKLTEGLKNE